MGCYDMVSVKCPKCKTYTTPQTKILGDNSLETFNTGDSFDSDTFDYRTCVLQLKDDCEHCGATLKIKILSGKYVCSTDDEPQYKELQWGELEKCDKE